jgi:hypothetical protein
MNQDVLRAVRKKRKLWKQAIFVQEEMARYRTAQREATRNLRNT